MKTPNAELLKQATEMAQTQGVKAACEWVSEQVAPESPAAMINDLANRLAAPLGQRVAIRGYLCALRHNRDLVPAWNNLGVAFLDLNKNHWSAQALREALKRQPDFAPALGNLAVIMGRLQQPEESLKLYERALELDPDRAELLNNIGNIYRERGELEQAESYFLAAIKKKPSYSKPYSNLGIVRHAQDRHDEAHALYEKALALEPAYLDALNNRANLLVDQRRYQEAIAYYRRALEVSPNSALTKTNMGLALMACGQYAEGFALFESRYAGHPHKLKYPSLPGRPWDGGPLDDRGLFLYSEQGFGDAIHFLRYVEPLRARHPKAQITVAVPKPLLRLFAPFGKATKVNIVDSSNAVVPRFDFHAPLLSLPHWLGAQQAMAMPRRIPYLFPDESLQEAWRQRLQPLPRPWVGVCFQGNPKLQKDRHRSLPEPLIQDFLGKIHGGTIIDLQKDVPITAERPVVRWMDEVGDFMDTAALMTQLDLIVSVDTSVVHVAGACGCPTVLLNRFDSDWRWFDGGYVSRWYPSVMVIWQRKVRDWPDALRRALALIGALG